MKRTAITIKEFADQCAKLEEGSSISFFAKVKERENVKHTATKIIFCGETAVAGDCENGGRPFLFDVKKYFREPSEICKMLDDYINRETSGYGYVDIIEEESSKHELNSETANKAGMYMLVSVVERDISTEIYQTYEQAYVMMEGALNKTLGEDGEEYRIDDDYGIDQYSAWSNADDDANSDWLIVPINKNYVKGNCKVYSLEEVFVSCLKEGKDSTPGTAAKAATALCNSDCDAFGVMLRYTREHPMEGIQEINISERNVVFKDSILS